MKAPEEPRIVAETPAARGPGRPHPSSRGRLRATRGTRAGRALVGARRALPIAAALLAGAPARVGAAPPEAGAEPAPAPGAEEPRPWRLDEALGLTELELGLALRTRFEHLENDFRVSNPGNATGLSSRTLLSARLGRGPVFGGVELIDSRIAASDTTPVNNSLPGVRNISKSFWLA